VPLNRCLYPDNWDEIARHVKEAAGWRCQACGRKCYPPGEVHKRGLKNWRKVLTVAHLDRDPANNVPENLAALCVVCHLNYDRPDNVRKAKRTRARKKAGATIPIPFAR